MREKALQDYRKKLTEHKEIESRLKESKFLCEIAVFTTSVAHLDVLIHLV